MKKWFGIVLILAVVGILIGAVIIPAIAQGGSTIDIPTEISYQGYLEDANGPVNDQCDFQFVLFGSVDGSDQIGSMQTKPDVSVSDGYFTVNELDFGVAAFNGEARHLELELENADVDLDPDADLRDNGPLGLRIIQVDIFSGILGAAIAHLGVDVPLHAEGEADAEPGRYRQFE